MTVQPRFLEAEWRYLAMLNYEIHPTILEEHLPAGCEPDTWSGRTFVSVVGFRFIGTRVLEIPIPFHRNFQEVNLRFYVRRKVAGTWRRGVVFIKEIVPRRAIALVARRLYGENYVALPMRHAIAPHADPGSTTLSYQWRRAGAWEGLSVRYAGIPSIPSDDAEETFITEHYWGYSRQADRSTVEYQVEHPRWRVWQATEASLSCDVGALYGMPFVEPLSGRPSSAFVAEGSAVIVRRGRRLGAHEVGSRTE